MNYTKDIEEFEKTFPWAAFGPVLIKYGYYLTITDLSHILGINRKDTSAYIQASKVPAKIMNGGKTTRYAFSDLPKIIFYAEQAQLEIFSKLSA